jgi:hypothetical protein
MQSLMPTGIPTKAIVGLASVMVGGVMFSGNVAGAMAHSVANNSQLQVGQLQVGPLQVGQNFTGIGLSEAGTIPSDSHGAVGNQHIMQVTNGAVAIYDKRNGQRLQQTSLDDFWRNTGLPEWNALGNFDPRIVYDPTSQRWFTTAADRTDANGNYQTFPLGNRVVLAVSNSADPTQGWRGFSLAASTASNPLFADAPTLGIDADGVQIAAVMFDAGLNSPTSTLLTIDKAQLLNPTADPLRYETRFGVPADQTGDALQTVNDFFRPADGQTEVWASRGSDELRRSTLLPGQMLQTATVMTQPFFAADYGLQPDRSRNLEIGDPRLSSNLVRVGDSIWTVQTVAGPTGNSRIRWTEIDANTNQVKQSGEIGVGETDHFYPSIAVNSAGRVVIGYNRSGANEFISSYAVAGTIQPNGKLELGVPILLKAGTGNYSQTFGSGRNRWGDYSATVFDPTDPLSFWTFQQVADRDNQWSTQITQVRFADRASVPEPTAGFGLLAAVGLVRYRRRR